MTIGVATISYSYDSNGNLDSVSDPQGLNVHFYHDLNRVHEYNEGMTSLTYTYDAANNLKSEDDFFGDIKTSYSYNTANEVTAVSNNTTGSVAKFVYTNGRPTQITYPGNVVTTIGYDESGREISTKTVKGRTVIADIKGSYRNAAGKDTQLLQGEIDNVRKLSTVYSYDSLNQLTGAKQTGTDAHSYTYLYDKNGNMTSSMHNSLKSVTYGYNAADQLVTSNDATINAYDKNGNQTTTQSGMKIAYNDFNQSTSFTPKDKATIKNTYVGSSQDQRVSNGNIEQANGLLGLHSEIVNNTDTFYTHLPTGHNQIIAEHVADKAYYYITDLRGSVIAMTNSSGAVVNTYRYDPYGNMIKQTGTVPNKIMFQGGYYDAQTKLYKFGHRYYNPAESRWTQLDPSSKNVGYIFASNNPINYSDPMGLDAQQVFQCAAGYISIAGGVMSLIGAGISAASTPITTAAGAAAFLGFGGAGLAAISGGAYIISTC